MQINSSQNKDNIHLQAPFWYRPRDIIVIFSTSNGTALRRDLHARLCWFLWGEELERSAAGTVVFYLDQFIVWFRLKGCLRPLVKEEPQQPFWFLPICCTLTTFANEVEEVWKWLYLEKVGKVFYWEVQSNQPKPVLVETVGPNRTQP